MKDYVEAAKSWSNHAATVGRLKNWYHVPREGTRRIVDWRRKTAKLIVGLAPSNAGTSASAPMIVAITSARRAVTNRRLPYLIAHYHQTLSLVALVGRLL